MHLQFYYDSTSPISSKCCSICYRLAIVQRGSFRDPQFGGWGVSGVGCVTNESHTTSQFRLNINICVICHRLELFQRESCVHHVAVKGELAGRDLRQSKAHTRLPNISQHKVLLYLVPPFGRNSNVKLCSNPNSTQPIWACGVENSTSRNLLPTFLFDLNTRSIWHRLATIHNAADTTERSE